VETAHDLKSPTPSRRSNISKLWIAALIIATLTAGLSISFGSFSAASANYSILCGGCDLGSPFPTNRTLSEIKNYVKVSAPEKPQSGDTITVCNGTACVKYTLDDSGNYIGDPPIPQTRTPPGGGGGGGGGVGGGGDFGGGQCSVRPRTGTACTEANGIRRCETFDDSMVDCGFG
jgi:hypothetical protein